MRTRTWLGLLAITTAVGAAAFFAVGERETATTAETPAGALFPELAARLNDTAAIEIATPGERFRIVRDKGERWVVAERSGYPADADRVKKTVLGLAELEALEPRTDNPDLYDRIGVGEPGAEGSSAIGVTLFAGDGSELAALIVGKVRTTESASRPAELYVRKPAEARSWLAAARLDVKDELRDWLDRTAIRVKGERVMETVISHADGDRVRIWRDAPEDRDFSLAEVPAAHEVDSQYKVNSIARALDRFVFQDVRKADEIDFTKEPVEVRMRTHDGLTVGIRLATLEDATWATFEVGVEGTPGEAPEAGEEGEGAAKSAAEVETEAALLKARLEGWAYELPDYTAEEITRRMSDLIKKTEAEKE